MECPSSPGKLLSATPFKTRWSSGNGRCALKVDEAGTSGRLWLLRFLLRRWLSVLSLDGWMLMAKVVNTLKWCWLYRCCFIIRYIIYINLYNDIYLNTFCGHNDNMIIPILFYFGFFGGWDERVKLLARDQITTLQQLACFTMNNWATEVANILGSHYKRWTLKQQNIGLFCQELRLQPRKHMD